MKQMLLLIAVAMLTACNNPNNAKPAGTPDQDAVTPTVNERVIDWTKPQYSLDMHGDTIVRWIYDASGQLSQLYILGERYEGDFEGEDNTSDGSYFSFDSKGRLQVIVRATDDDVYRYEFKYGYEEEEEVDEDEWRSPYAEEDVEMEYDDLDRVTYMSFRVRWSHFSARLSYEGNQCYVDATFSVPQMDELNIPIGTDPDESYYEYYIFY